MATSTNSSTSEYPRITKLQEQQQQRSPSSTPTNSSTATTTTMTIVTASPTLPPSTFSIPSSSSSNIPMTMMMMMTPPTHPIQLNGIVYPHPHDVLCGRGTLGEHDRCCVNANKMSYLHLRYLSIFSRSYLLILFSVFISRYLSL